MVFFSRHLTNTIRMYFVAFEQTALGNRLLTPHKHVLQGLRLEWEFQVRRLLETKAKMFSKKLDEDKSLLLGNYFVSPFQDTNYRWIMVNVGRYNKPFFQRSLSYSKIVVEHIPYEFAFFSKNHFLIPFQAQLVHFEIIWVLAFLKQVCIIGWFHI